MKKQNNNSIDRFMAKFFKQKVDSEQKLQ